MKPATSIGVLLTSTLVMMTGFGSVGPLAQVSSPPTETMPPPGEGAGGPIEAPTAEPPASSEAVQERRVPGLLPPGSGILQQPAGALPQPTQPTNTFYVVSYGGKCLDFGGPSQVSGSPVFISWCNGNPAQQVQVQEINDRHEVILHAGTKVIGVRGATASPVLSRALTPQIQPLTRPPAPLSPPPPVALTPLPAQIAPPPAVAPTPQVPLSPPPLAYQPPVVATSEALLELQDEEQNLLKGLYSAGYGQIFALDGDSIIMAADRTRVVQVQNNRGANGTALVLGPRNLADAEFWTFVAADQTPRKPTSGFVRVPRIADPKLHANDFVDAVTNATWGTVIDVEPGASIDLTNSPQLAIPEGVTIRGNRRGTLFGPELSTANIDATMLEIKGNDVRITGLRLRGPSSDPSGADRNAVGIYVRDRLLFDPVPPPGYIRSIIDHNDMSAWTHAAVRVDGYDGDKYKTFCPPLPPLVDHQSRPENVRVVRNFIQNNQRQDGGYGVSALSGGYVRVEGNTFVHNRHAVTGENGYARSGFRAWYNLVLSDAALQNGLYHTQDFDMHGTDEHSRPVDHVGGRGGEYVEIARNTFLGTQFGHDNFDLRGNSCYLDEFHHNVSLQSQDKAIACSICGIAPNDKGIVYQPLPTSTYINVTPDNHFNSANPTNHLGVGDFDGDGVDDLFLATGAAWYYAPQGNAEWRFLNAQTDGIGTLLFGDFDADGRTDVFTQHGANWDVSWGGASQWDTINVSGPILGNAAVGDFDGDHYADVFWSGEGQWFISYRGVGQFTRIGPSSFLVRDLGFGDFNNDGKTDIVGVVSGQWMVAHGGTQGIVEGWQPLRPALTKTMAGLMIADFNGDGRADIATAELGYAPSGKSLTPFWNWKVSWAGTGNWTPLRTVYGPPVGVGRFDATRGADILVWENPMPMVPGLSYLNTTSILSSGVGAPVRYSRQDMR